MTPDGIPARAMPGLGYMTIRVYQVDPRGKITRDGRTVVVPPAAELPPLADGYPPCQCPRHRGGTP
ncbi:hypothetical protein [Streptomyces sp. NPDC006012]|uniref:hypothetical protein n=1 Tax=Streptomyces sp. NPDC006012 TaxID=3364739 RepID=UPI003696BE49